MGNDLVRRSSDVPELKRADGFFSSLFQSRTERINHINRSVIEYKPNRIEAFLPPGSASCSCVISGGVDAVRSNVVCAQIACAAENHLPVIILHEGDLQLAEAVRSRFGKDPRYVEISPQVPAFEPMYGLSGLEISNEIVQSTPPEFDMKYNVKYYLDGVASLMNGIGKSTSFHMFATCPHLRIFDLVDDAQTQGKITDQTAQEIRSRLMMGQSENFKLDSVLAGLQMEMDPVLWKNGCGLEPVNVFTAIKEHRILCFDIVSLSSQMMTNIIIYQLKLALSRRMPCMLVIDSLPVNANRQYQDFLKMSSNLLALTLVSDDLYAMTGGDDRLFDSFVGRSGLAVILSHKSGASAKKWADAVGQYDEWVDSYSKNYGTQTNPRDIWSSHSSGNSTSTSRNRAYKVRPEWISGMGDTEAYIISQARRETAHIQLLI